MAKVQILIEIGILLGSFLFGLIFFYLASPSPLPVKKERMDLMASQLINYVIFIWLGKIIFHIKLFLQDPFAVLAYPSSSEAFYIATLFFIGTILVQSYRGKLSITALLEVFVPVVIASSFMYEFIQMQFFEKDAFFYLLVFILLLIAYVILDKNLSNQILLFFLWATGLLFISFLAPFVMIFQFIVTRIFIIILMLIIIMVYLYYRRRNKT